MNVIIPIAGLGTRLRPHTFTINKALLRVGEKRVIDYIIDSINYTCNNVSRIVFIIGYLGEQLKEYINKNYVNKFNSLCFVEQKERLGLAHAVWQAKYIVNDEPSLIIYGDTIFTAKIHNEPNIDGYIGVYDVIKAGIEPSRVGIIEVKNGYITKLVEKPEITTYNLGIAGVNLINNTILLWECIEEIIKLNKKTKGEFQITDAFNLMVEKGAKFKYFYLDKWLDCGTNEAIISVNRELLLNGNYIDNSAKIENSVIGKYVSIGPNAQIYNSTINDCIIYEEAVIKNCRLSKSIIGKGAKIIGVNGEINVGELCEIKENKNT